ncbi:MAG: hypothetical protein KDD48_03470 [Bdellovibrionales bacterium]|nr:hypothetical protein [Bdellovibrionales bacterium]
MKQKKYITILSIAYVLGCGSNNIIQNKKVVDFNTLATNGMANITCDCRADGTSIGSVGCDEERMTDCQIDCSDMAGDGVASSVHCDAAISTPKSKGNAMF